MGTSAKNGGPGAGSPLIPSWLNPSPPTGPVAAPSGLPPQQSGPPGQLSPPSPPPPGQEGLPPRTPLPPSADPNRFRSARTHLNRVARGHGRGGGRDLGRAVGEYVRKGYGGGRGLSGRVSNSSRAAGNMLGFAQAIRDQGFQEAVKQFGLQGLVGKPIEEAAAILIDAFAKEGVTTDDNITREAWCETVQELLEQGRTDFETLTPEQWAEAVEKFIGKAIELRTINEIGNDAVGIAPDVATLDQVVHDLESLIKGQVQDKIVPLIKDGQRRSIEELNKYVDEIVSIAGDYLEALAGEEEG